MVRLGSLLCGQTTIAVVAHEGDAVVVDADINVPTSRNQLVQFRDRQGPLGAHIL
jgi:hypothetical protein